MARMKRLISLLCALVLMLVSPPATLARAEESGTTVSESGYAVAETDNVWFYSEPDESKGLFMIPKSYYVKFVLDGNPFCMVEYGTDSAPYRKLTGYCQKSQLRFVDFLPERPYLNLQVTVTYKLSETLGGAFDKIDRTFVYYGLYYRGTACYWYVFADGVFDYVPADGKPDYPLNTDYLHTESGEPPAEQAAAGLSGVQIALICIAVVAAVAVAVVVLYGKKLPVKRRD